MNGALSKEWHVALKITNNFSTISSLIRLKRLKNFSKMKRTKELMMKRKSRRVMK